MIDFIVSFAVKRRWLVMAATLLVAVFGVYNMTRLSIDAVPDITNVQVQINTKATGAALSVLQPKKRAEIRSLQKK